MYNLLILAYLALSDRCCCKLCGLDFHVAASVAAIGVPVGSGLGRLFVQGQSVCQAVSQYVLSLPAKPALATGTTSVRRLSPHPLISYTINCLMISALLLRLMLLTLSTAS